jgi:hypothetical protein
VTGTQSASSSSCATPVWIRVPLGIAVEDALSGQQRAGARYETYVQTRDDLESQVQQLAAEIKGEWMEARKVLTKYLRSVDDVVEVDADDDVYALKRDVRALAISNEWAWHELLRAARESDERALDDARLLRHDARQRLKRIKAGARGLRRRVGRDYELMPSDFPERPKSPSSKGFRGIKPEVLDVEHARQNPEH